ncbi:MAG: glycoside hydrolase family 3 [Gammaproteobacteria bacterium]|nr:MAG: glycoside hydrolase family 3 [Gammaproteobacteria bacterium]
MKKNKGIQNSVIVFILIFMIGLFTVSCVGNHEQDEIIPVPIISPRPQQPIPKPEIPEPKTPQPEQDRQEKPLQVQAPEQEQSEPTLPPIHYVFTPAEKVAKPGISLEMKIGQMLIVGFRGLSVNHKSPIVRDIKRFHLGGVILFDYDTALRSWKRNIRSPSQVKKLVAQLQKASQIPLFIAIDQEGGKIRRLKKKFGFPSTVSAQYLGKKNDLALTYQKSAGIAKTLAGVGINFNFAPVVDLNTNPNNPIIGKLERSFSDEPEIVIEHALEFIKAHHTHHVFCALKHFPGHGSSTKDSHLGLVDVTDTWEEIELEPYSEIIKAGMADAIMIAHVFNRRYDENYPATLSKNIVNGVLRTHLSYNGVVVSDDIQMKAITNHYRFEEAVFATLDAGIDIIVIGNNLKFEKNIVARTVAVIKQLIKKGKISEERIDESYRRIQILKSRF